jgi:multidrug efflux pump subunit AcrA (membrane-fusion protein)
MDVASIREQIRSLRANPAATTYLEDYCALLLSVSRAENCLLFDLDNQGNVVVSACAPGENDWFKLQAYQIFARNQERLFNQGGAAKCQVSDQLGQMHIIVAVCLSKSPVRMAVLCLPIRESSRLNELLVRVELVADLAENQSSEPAPFASEPASQQLLASVGADLIGSLELIADVMNHPNFGSAVLMLVNGLAAQLGCSMAALGWIDRGHMHIEAISHISRFDYKTEHTRLLESTCEEAFDQSRQLIYPDNQDDTVVLYAHRQLAQTLGFSRVISIPLFNVKGSCQAVFLLAEQELPVTAGHLEAITVSLGLLLPWLTERRLQDRWWGRRLLSWGLNKLGRLIGPENLWQKLAVLTAVAGILYICLASWPFRLEAVGQIITDRTRQIGAPFDGYVDQAYVTTGDEIEAGKLLARLDVKDLILQEAEVRAEIRRQKAEIDKARAQKSLADVAILEARLAQSDARLKRILQQLSQAEIRAPYHGVVVEGESKDLLGVPVRKGDRLFRLAQVEDLYGQLELPESQIRFLEPQAAGKFSLLAQPNQRIPFRVTSVVPMAQVKGQQGNHFIVKVVFTQAPEDWWRPGMSGVARIDAGDRPIIWLWTYRLIDSLRMRLWF